MFNGPSLYPEYLTDAKVIVCPSDEDGIQSYEGGRYRDDNGTTQPCLFDTLSYVYLGWVLQGHEIIAGGQAGKDHNDPTFDIADLAGDVLLKFVEAISTVDPVTGQPTLIDQDVGDLTEGQGNAGGTTVYRLREGIERFMIADINNPAATAMAQSEIAVMWDIVDANAEDFNHLPGGGNVLYMDGHVEFIRYPGEFPVDRAFALMVWLVGELL